MRVIETLGLVVIAAVCALAALGPLSNLWSDYQDSPTSTYLILGIPPLLVALAVLFQAVRVWRRGSRGESPNPDRVPPTGTS